MVIREQNGICRLYSKSACMCLSVSYSVVYFCNLLPSVPFYHGMKYFTQNVKQTAKPRCPLQLEKVHF